MAELAIVTTVGGAFLSASLQVLFDKLANPAIQEFGSLLGVGYELKRLRDTVLKIQSVVADAETRQVKDPGLALWLRELKDAAYDAEDVLDDFATELLQKKKEGGGSGSGHMRRLLSSISPTQFFSDYNILDKINEIRKRLDDIAKERDDLGLADLDVGWNSRRPETTRSRRETTSFLGNVKVFGRVAEREEIVRLLLEADSHDAHSTEPFPKVLAIVGMGGLGKTTLAQLVFHDPKVQEQFEVNMWVWVSNEFDLRRLTQDMMESSGESCHGIASLDALQNKLAGRLKGKRFLLVLDDVWNENHEDWCKLCAPLIHGNKGSTVIVTTRNKDIADILRALEPFCLKELPVEDCWSIFKRCAFVGGDSRAHPKLEEIGREIAKKANGVPLVAKMLGNLLYGKLEQWRWRCMLRSEMWTLPQGEQDIFSSLRLSYQHLPTHLKQCFAYCSLFPKGHKFEKQKIVQMWMAQDFIHVRYGERIEDVGGNYFNYLLRRSFFQPCLDGYGYVMHDLLHDLALIVSFDECLRIGEDTLQKTCKFQHHVRHLSLSCSINFNKMYEFRNARTLLNLCWQIQQDDPPDLFNWGIQQNELCELLDRLKFLRVLDLSYSNFFHLPESIGNLKHLRYLDLSNIAMSYLPESFSGLHNLQSFRLKDCILLKKLPKGISNLINLWHLVADAKLVSKIVGIGKLTSLQELELFNVSRDGSCKIEELKHLNELSGRFCIGNLENVKDKKEARHAELNNKLHLDALELEWCDNWSAGRRNYRLDQEVLESLQPNPNLRNLTIKCYGGTDFPSWMDVNYISNIESIHLYKCKKLDFIPCLGKLPFLKYLSIEGMDNVKQVGQEFTGSGGVGFPLLETLEFCHMPEWVEWLMEMEGQSFSCLRKLDIRNCPKLRSSGLPLSAQLKSLQIEGCPGVLNESLFIMLQNQSSLSFSMKINYPNLESCIKEALQYLTALKELKICYDDDLVTSNSLTNQESSITLKYCLVPEYPSDVELDINNNSGENLLSLCLQNNLNSLSSFSVHGCPDISSLCLEEVLPHLKSLEELEISCCRKLMELRWLQQQLISLKQLRIQDCQDLVCLPREVLIHQTALEKLYIGDCGELTSLGFQALVSLKSMWIERCPKFMVTVSLPTSYFEDEDLLSPIHSLSIDSTSLLPTGFVQNLNSLRNLKIIHCSQLMSFSDHEEEGLLSIISLQYLEFNDCQNMQHLPTELHKLSSLKSLLIQYCPQLQSLPEKGLPPFLELLEIAECPILIRRCQRETGLDWPIIANIPQLKIHSEETKSKDLLA